MNARGRTGWMIYAMPAPSGSLPRPTTSCASKPAAEVAIPGINVVSAADLAGELARVSSQVAALAVCITAGPQAGSFGPAPRNLVIGQHVRASEALTVADWADFLVCDVDRTDQLRSLRQFAVPVVVHRRRSPQVESVAAARRECDVLQRDLATEGDFAGYVVSR